MKNKKSYWKTIGHVGVDSGSLMVIDPCYATSFDDKDYDKFVIGKSNERATQVPFDLGHTGRAVIFESGIGDGCYEVRAKFETLEDWGERITEVRVMVLNKNVGKITKHFFGKKKI